MYRNMLISVSCDCKTVKNVVTGNSSSKPDRTGRDGKFVKQSKMLNNSAYSRLGNNIGWRSLSLIGRIQIPMFEENGHAQTMGWRLVRPNGAYPWVA